MEIIRKRINRVANMVKTNLVRRSEILLSGLDQEFIDQFEDNYTLPKLITVVILETMVKGSLVRDHKEELDKIREKLASMIV